MNDRSQCPLCKCYHFDTEVSPCLDEPSLRNALFGKAEIELTEPEALALLWLASISDSYLREALLSLFQKARRSAQS